MFQYYVWRVRYVLIALVCAVALCIICAVVNLIISSVKDNSMPVEVSDLPPMFIVERTYTRDEGYTYIYSDGKFLYDDNLQRLPKLSPSNLDRIEIDIETPAIDDFKTFTGSKTIDPLSIDKANFQYDIPYNYYGTGQDIALYVALMLGAGFEPESLYETKDSAVLVLSFDEEMVRIVIGRNRLRVYSKMIGADEFG